MIGRAVGHDRRPGEDDRVGARRREVLLHEHLQPVDDGQERAPRAHPVRPDPEVHEGDQLHLQVDVQEGDRDRDHQDDRRRGDEPDDPHVRGEDVDDRAAEDRDHRDEPDRQDQQDRDEREDDLPRQVSRPQAPRHGGHLSMPPMIGSRDALTVIQSAISRPGDEPAEALEVQEARVVDAEPERLVRPVADRVDPVLAARPLDRREGAAGARDGAAAAAWPGPARPASGGGTGR